MEKRTIDRDVLYTLFLRSSNIGLNLYFSHALKLIPQFFLFTQRMQGKHVQHLTRTDKETPNLKWSYKDVRRVSGSEGSYFYCEAL